MSSKHGSKSGIACSIFRREIEFLREQNLIKTPFKYIGSMLHMQPEVLDRHLRERIDIERQNGSEILLVYGECCPHMNEIEGQNQINRISGLNCCEILLGPDLYRKLRSEGAFFLMPEWVHRWREVFEFEIGLNDDMARSLMKELHTKLIYIDTGLVDIPEQLLREIAEYCGLPVEILPVSLDQFSGLIKNAE